MPGQLAHGHRIREVWISPTGIFWLISDQGTTRPLPVPIGPAFGTGGHARRPWLSFARHAILILQFPFEFIHSSFHLPCCLQPHIEFLL